MSFSTKIFLCLILVLMLSLPLAASPHAQTEGEPAIDFTQHEANVWEAKVDFWRKWEARQRLLDEHTARTWEAKTEYFRDLAINEHIARTWEAKAAFWQNHQLATE